MVCISNPKFVFYIAAVAEEHETSPHFTETEVSEENIPESLTRIVKRILFVEEETAKLEAGVSVTASQNITNQTQHNYSDSL